MFEISINSGFNVRYDNAVLIIIDMVRGFTDLGDLSSSFIKGIAPRIRSICYKFSDIIAINDEHDENDCEFKMYPKHCLAGSDESKICDELCDVSFTHILSKNCTNGFFSKDFMKVFGKYLDNNFDFFVVGCCVDICVLQFCLTFKGYLNSINKDLNVFLPVDLVDTYDSENHKRDLVKNASLYLMSNYDIRLIDSNL